MTPNAARQARATQDTCPPARKRPLWPVAEGRLPGRGRETGPGGVAGGRAVPLSWSARRGTGGVSAWRGGVFPAPSVPNAALHRRRGPRRPPPRLSPTPRRPVHALVRPGRTRGMATRRRPTPPRPDTAPRSTGAPAESAPPRDGTGRARRPGSGRWQGPTPSTRRRVRDAASGHTHRPPPARRAERCASAAAGSGSEVRADAGGSQRQGVVRARLGGRPRTYASWDMHNQLPSQATPGKNTYHLQKKDLVLRRYIVRKDVPCKNHKGVASLPYHPSIFLDTKEFRVIQRVSINFGGSNDPTISSDQSH